MYRPRLLIMLFLFSFPTLHADEDATDRIAVELSKAQGAYLNSLDAAKARLLKHLDNLIAQAEQDTSIDVNVQLELIDTLKAERQAFDADHRQLPKSTYTRVASSRFSRELAVAGTRCARAFDVAARTYQRKRQLDKARAVLEDKEKFFLPEVEPAFTGADKRFIDFCKKVIQENETLYFYIITNKFDNVVVRATKEFYVTPPHGLHPEHPNAPSFKGTRLDSFDGKLSNLAVQYGTHLFTTHNKRRITPVD